MLTYVLMPSSNAHLRPNALLCKPQLFGLKKLLFGCVDTTFGDIWSPREARAAWTTAWAADERSPRQARAAWTTAWAADERSPLGNDILINTYYDIY